MTKPLIYFTAPYDHRGGQFAYRTVGLASEVSVFCTPILPALNQFLCAIQPQTEEYLLEYRLELLSKCDGLVMLAGEGFESNPEYLYARDMRMPILDRVRTQVYSEDFDDGGVRHWLIKLWTPEGWGPAHPRWIHYG